MAVPHVVLVLGLLLSLARNGAAQRSPIGYAIDVTDRSDDQFSVTAWVSGLTSDNAVYQFAATAPGTYQVMDIGRFVRSFEAFDAAGRPVPVERVSVNQWKLGDAPRVRTLRYTVAETWDTKVDRHQVYLMCGTSMEKDHVLINPHAVIGYPTGMQTRPIRLRVKYPASWMVGTALERDRGGAYLAEDYDQLVDSPILLGRLTEARTRVTGVPVRDLHLLQDRPDQVGPAPRRDARDAPGGGTVPGQASGGPIHLPLPLRGPARRVRGSTRSAPSTSSRKANSPIRWAATSPTSRRTSSSTW